jgi:hypothetical protein
MRVVVELNGAARAIAGTKLVWTDIPDTGTYQDVIRFIADQYPGLVGVVISPDKCNLLNANIFSKNGEDLILDEGMLNHPSDEEKLYLLSVIVGG